MDLIERYLAAVGRQLPSKQAADIKAELRDVLMSRVEEQEAGLGRPLTRGELERVLVDFGNPLVVAARYRKVQHLIGPEVFPFWWAAVKLMLAIVAGVYLVLIAIGALAHKTPAEFNRTVPAFPVVVIYLFGLITLAFAGFELFGKTAFLRQWKPSRLPPAAGKTRSRFELAAEITMNVVFLLWWFGLIRVGDVMPYADILGLSLAPVWAAWRWPIAAYSALEIAGDLVAIARPGWVWANGGVMIGRSLLGIGILAGILRAGHWVTVGGVDIPPEAIAELQTNIDLGMRIGIAATMAGLGVRIALQLWRLRRVRQASAGVLRPA